MSNDYASNDNFNQNRDPYLFYTEYVGEEVHNRFIKYTDMKNKNPFQIIDLSFQIDHINPMKVQLFEEYRGATNNARLFMILFRHRESKIISNE